MCLTQEEKRKYEAFLKSLAKAKSPDLFSNGGVDHATLLYRILMENSKSHVRIFCEEGVSQIWSDESVRKAMKEFLKKKTEESPAVMQVLVENPNDNGFDDLKAEGDITVIHATQEDRDRIHRHFKNDRCNFAVYDDNMFRYEYDKEKYKAYGSFNSPMVAKTMIALFDSIWTAPHHQNAQ